MGGGSEKGKVPAFQVGLLCQRTFELGKRADGSWFAHDEGDRPCRRA